MPSIVIPPPTEDEKQYLENILESQKFSDHVVKNCTCPVGGPPGVNDPPCPVHGEKRLGEVQFDAESSPHSIQNRTAARARNWKFNTDRQCYVDTDGSKVADRFGQRY